MPAAHAWLHWYMKRKCRKFHIRRDGYSQYVGCDEIYRNKTVD